MTDVIAQLREACGNLPEGEWYQDGTEVRDNDENDILFIDTSHLSLQQDKDIAAFIVVAHNKMPQILAVLSVAEDIANGPDCGNFGVHDLRAALSALKGGAE